MGTTIGWIHQGQQYMYYDDENWSPSNPAYIAFAFDFIYKVYNNILNF